MRSRDLLLASVMFLLAVSLGASQRPDESRPGVIEITTSLVPIDVVVTDSQGRSVAGLTREDFQILQDGKAQPITTFLTISAGPKVSASAVSRAAPSRALSRDEVRRTIAFVVDDFTLTMPFKPPKLQEVVPGLAADAELFEPLPPLSNFRPLSRVRAVLRDFFERETREGDLMALLTLGKHQGGFEQFTTDRELLKTLTMRLEPNPAQLLMRGYGGELSDTDLNGRPVPLQALESLAEIPITALRAVVDGMKGMPGRKSIVLFSTGMHDNLALRRLIDIANRAGITFYTIDSRDPSTPERPEGGRPDSRPQIALGTLASDTGGKSWDAREDLGPSLAGALEDQETYYLLGYNPGQETFDRRFHKIEVRALRSGLRVRSRSGFDGQPDNNQAEPTDPAGILSRLIQSPYRNATVHTRLSSFVSAADGAPSLRSVVFIDGQDLQADRAADGTYRGSIEMMVAIVDPKGEISGQVARGFRFSLDAEGWRRARETGLAYTLPHPIGKPGPYQVRLAVRDAVSGETGTASALLMVPDLKKDPLNLSGLILSAPAAEVDAHPLSTPAARTFRAGRAIAWTMEVYHSKANPKLQAAVRVLREGQPMREIPFTPVEAKRIGNGSAVADSLQIGSDLEPGEYVLHVNIRDEDVKKSEVSQFIDFRVIPAAGALR